MTGSGPAQPAALPDRTSGDNARPSHQGRAEAVVWRCVYALGATLIVVVAADIAGRAVWTFGAAGKSWADIVRVVSGVSLGLVAGFFSRHGVEVIRRDLRHVLRRSDR